MWAHVPLPSPFAPSGCGDDGAIHVSNIEYKISQHKKMYISSKNCF